jgi:hypothetical protein
MIVFPNVLAAKFIIALIKPQKEDISEEQKEASQNCK